MTQEYEFFKDFAGVTESDLEMFKCGGGMKKSKKENGGPLKKKTESSKTYKQWTEHFAPKQKLQSMDDMQNDLRIQNEQKKGHDEAVKNLQKEQAERPERFNNNGSRNLKHPYNKALDRKDQKGNESYNPYSKKKK